MKHKYIVTGATGKIGSAFVDKIGEGNYIGISRHWARKNLLKVDLSNWNGQLDGNFSDFDTVVHLAAKAHIDDCEEDRPLGKRGETWKDNVDATKNVVEFCRNTKKKLIFLSTECVFDGKKLKYTEKDQLCPINWYGVTKLESENIVASLPGALILRTVMAYDGRFAHKDIVRNFVSKLEKGKKVFAAIDQTVSFTYTRDIINAIVMSSVKDLKGIYHFAGRDAISVYQLVIEIGKLIGANSNLIIPATMKEILGKKRAALRLKNSVLDSSKFSEDTGLMSVGIIDGLRESLKI
jgi:dTDP-4-dehydrorhamnose reductase